MPRDPKVFFNNTVVELSSSTQEGLPIVAAAYMKVLIEGILAAAAKAFPLTICHYCFLPNHFHLLAIVQDPADVPDFVGYLKGEVAHAINILLGRKQHTVWVEGYYSPTILDMKKMLERMRYLYLNPTEAGLETSVSIYPNISSYDALVTGSLRKTCKKIPRNCIPVLPKRKLEVSEQIELADKLLSGPGQSVELEVQPWAWLQCFEEAADENATELSTLFLEELRKEEEEIARHRTIPAATAASLRMQDPRTPYQSQRDGFKTACLGSDREKRTNFIRWFKEDAKTARLVFRAWKRGNTKLRPPPGFFAPGGYLFAAAVFPLLPL